MPDVSLDFRYLRYVLLVAQFGSFRAAAESENMTQSTISRRVSILERRVGVKLFERNHNGARLTAAGERFVQTAAYSAEQLRETIREVRETVRGEIGQLRIGLMTSLAAGPMADIIEDFHRLNPRIELTFEETSSDGAIVGLLCRRLDAAFLPNVLNLPGCETLRLYEEELYLAVSSAHRLASASTAAWEDIAGEEFILPSGAAGGELDEFLLHKLSNGKSAPRISIQYIGRENLLNLVARDCGVGLVLASTAAGMSRSDVALLQLSGAEEKIAFSLVWSATSDNPARQKLVDIARKLAR